jgi:hypothetical protein
VGISRRRNFDLGRAVPPPSGPTFSTPLPNLASRLKRRQRKFAPSGTEPGPVRFFPRIEEIAMRSLLLWLVGVPIPIIIILWLVFGHA